MSQPDPIAEREEAKDYARQDLRQALKVARWQGDLTLQDIAVELKNELDGDERKVLAGILLTL